MSLLSSPLIGYILKASVRDRLILSLLILLIITVCISIFLGETAVTEKDQNVIILMASSTRLISVLALSLFVVFHIRRSFEVRDIEYLLSRPISRSCYVLSHGFAFSLLGLLFTVAICTTLFALFHAMLNPQGFFLWTVSLLVELVIVVNGAMFFALVLPSAISGALAILAAYVFARMSGQILGTIDSGFGGGLYDFLGKIVEASSLIVPRFDLLGQSSWLLFGPDGVVGITYILIHGLAFLTLILCASIFDLMRKEF